MFPAYDIVKRALNWYQNREDVAYWMGAKGETLTMRRMQELVSAYSDYFSKYTPERLAELMAWSKGKIGFDCSGLVSVCAGLKGLSSWTLWDKTVNRTTVRNCKAGSFLWRPGHIGIDIGYGYFIDIAAEGQTVRLLPNSKGTFTNGGEYTGADYSMMSNF